MNEDRLARAAARTAATARARLAEDIDNLCADAGLSHAALARAAGVPASFLARILAGKANPSIETYARITTVLGADLATRVYPNTGPAIRDRHSVPILEGLLGCLHGRWAPYTEVAVRRPSRGWIDVALHDGQASLLLATEIQSVLRRIEQLVRWSGEKAASLPSWDRWPHLGEPEVSRLLVVRWTRSTREAAAAAARQLRVAYPGHPDDAMSALTGTAPWPGSSIVWAHDEGGMVRLVGRR